MKRKFIAILLGIMLTIPKVSFGSEVKKSEILTEVILAAKKQIAIPEALSEFSYREDDALYYLYWNNKEENQRVHIQCEADGDILRYYYHDGESYNGIAQVSYGQAKQAAEVFLYQVAPNYMENLRLMEPTAPNKGEDYVFNYEVVHEGIKLFQQRVEVCVSKQTGKVVGFDGVSYDQDTQFDSNQPKLSMEEAEKMYLKEIGVDLKYFTYRDDENKEQSYLAYQIMNDGCKGISAQNGKVIEHYSKLSYKESEMDVGVMSDRVTMEENELTLEEQKEVDLRKTFIDPTVIYHKGAELFPVLSKMEIETSVISQWDEVYRRRIELKGQNGESASLTVNAMTGEILNYHYHEPGIKIMHVTNKQTPKEGWSNEKASSLLQKIEPERFKAMELISSDEGEADKEWQYYIFQRMENGIPVEGDTMTLTYDIDVDGVISYYKYWSNAIFAKPESILTQEETIKNIGLELVYMKSGENQYALAYNHQKASMCLDAFTAQEVDYRGQVVEKEENIGFYQDIKGHPYETIITSLYHSGIYLETKQLKPNAIITKKELLELLNQMDNMENESIDNKQELGQTLTKEQGIYYLVERSMYGKLASKQDIFDYPYQDEEVDKKLKGYIAVAYGLDWLPKQDRLNPKAGLTKAEAMLYIYNVMNQKK